jgi:hypothetical protein
MEHFKLWVEGLSLTVAASTVVGWLPPIAALLSIIWVSIQIHDRFAEVK